MRYSGLHGVTVDERTSSAASKLANSRAFCLFVFIVSLFIYLFCCFYLKAYDGYVCVHKAHNTGGGAGSAPRESGGTC